MRIKNTNKVLDFAGNLMVVLRVAKMIFIKNKSRNSLLKLNFCSYKISMTFMSQVFLLNK
ncbi:hypothetical protein BUY94_09710 [Mammaliicoccus fleurettii]|nr:hypothetical protein B2G86_12625 [Mammaliicoccus fleurettii]PTE32725.1 hypothetical protein BUY94_09710 [Mammaliicoccus fleurettii]RIL51552.1 hypothetical protein BUY93_04985 [Mammaliicoccus fleurettii]HCN60123.1 hypothetical protein [Staphylococcus sp.]